MEAAKLRERKHEDSNYRNLCAKENIPTDLLTPLSHCSVMRFSLLIDSMLPASTRWKTACAGNGKVVHWFVCSTFEVALIHRTFYGRGLRSSLLYMRSFVSRDSLASSTLQIRSKSPEMLAINSGFAPHLMDMAGTTLIIRKLEKIDCTWGLNVDLFGIDADLRRSGKSLIMTILLIFFRAVSRWKNNRLTWFGGESKR